MMWVCRGIAAGAVVMVPNALPVLVVFGGMGWLGIPVDIGSMMAASIALGVAVDDTIHFLAWYKDDLRALGDRSEAVLASYRRSATATLQAGLINGLGLSVFATSSFTPTQRFGWLMLTILIAGIIAELIMLPAIMFGPIGRVFDLKQPKASAAAAKAKIETLLSPLDRRRALREHEASVEA
jgi:predicted RND superfamily exporter protein